MTVSSNIPVNNYTGNSSTQIFDFDFFIENEQELEVYHYSEEKIKTLLKCGIDYSIAEIGNKNGSYVIFPIENSTFGVLKPTEKLSLSLTLPIKQESEFHNSSYFNLNILEWTFDYIVRILQIFSRKIERCLKVEEGANASVEALMDNINFIHSSIKESQMNVSQMNDNVEKNAKLVGDLIVEIAEQADIVTDYLEKSIEAVDGVLNKTQVSNCVLESPNGVVKNIDSSLFVQKGLKILIPNGKNIDGSFKNIEYTLLVDSPVSELCTSSYLIDTNGICSPAPSDNYVEQNEKPTFSNGVWFDINSNVMYEIINGELEQIFKTKIFELVLNKETHEIASIKEKQTLRIVDYNDAVLKNSLVEITPSFSFPDFTAGVAFSLPYTVPNDGWALIQANDSNSATYVYVDGVTIFYHATVQNNRFDSTDLIPVRKGAVVTGGGSFETLVFYPCKGAQ